MQIWRLEHGSVCVGVTRVGGQLDGVAFQTPAGPLAPLHAAPWAHETLPDDVPPMLRTLRGDFFCAPFGDNDAAPEETRPHGATANADWELAAQEENRLVLELTRPVLGARVVKEVLLRADHPVVYQQHELIGGEGALPLGHHAMLRLDTPGLIGCAPFAVGLTPPTPLEPDPDRGRSLLAYPQDFDDLANVATADGGRLDLTRFPTEPQHEDLLQLLARPDATLDWCAVTAPDAGWIWFALKDARQFPGRILWMSNGGRYYPPFSRRHTGVLGVEEVVSCFHLGHRASLAENSINQRGAATAADLRPDSRVSWRYAFGAVAAPPGFGRAVELRCGDQEIELLDADGRGVRVAVDFEYVLSA